MRSEVFLRFFFLNYICYNFFYISIDLYKILIILLLKKTFSILKCEGILKMKIALFCSGGMSTSLVGSKMQKAYEAMGKNNVEVEAYDFAMIDEIGDKVDVIIIAPQISWAFDQVKSAHPNKKIISLTMAEFGAMDGVSIIERLNNEGVIPE